MAEILILYYSERGSTKRLANYIADGVEKVPNARSRIRTVPRFSNMGPSVPTNGPPYVELVDLKECAGLAMGSPSYFGNMAAPLKHFIDSTGSAWLSGALINKPACVFTSTNSLHGGQETTLISMMLPLIHHGMLILGLPYSCITLSTTQSGGTPYGASHHSGKNHNERLTEDEKAIALELGQRLAIVALKMSC